MPRLCGSVPVLAHEQRGRDATRVGTPTERSGRNSVQAVHRFALSCRIAPDHHSDSTPRWCEAQAALRGLPRRGCGRAAPRRLFLGPASRLAGLLRRKRQRRRCQGTQWRRGGHRSTCSAKQNGVTRWRAQRCPASMRLSSSCWLHPYAMDPICIILSCAICIILSLAIKLLGPHSNAHTLTPSSKKKCTGKCAGYAGIMLWTAFRHGQQQPCIVPTCGRTGVPLAAKHGATSDRRTSSGCAVKREPRRRAAISGCAGTPGLSALGWSTRTCQRLSSTFFS